MDDAKSLYRYGRRPYTATRTLRLRLRGGQEEEFSDEEMDGVRPMEDWEVSSLMGLAPSRLAVDVREHDGVNQQRDASLGAGLDFKADMREYACVLCLLFVCERERK